MRLPAMFPPALACTPLLLLAVHGPAAAQTEAPPLSCAGEVTLPEGSWETIWDHGPTESGQMQPWDEQWYFMPDEVDLGDYRVHLRLFQEEAGQQPRGERRRFYHAAVEDSSDGRCAAALVSEEELFGGVRRHDGGSSFRPVAAVDRLDRLVFQVESTYEVPIGTDESYKPYRIPVLAWFEEGELGLEARPGPAGCFVRVVGESVVTCEVHPVGGGASLPLSDLVGGPVGSVYLVGTDVLLVVEDRVGPGALHLVSSDGSRHLTLDAKATYPPMIDGPAVPTLAMHEGSAYVLDGTSRVVLVNKDDPWNPSVHGLASLQRTLAPIGDAAAEQEPDVLLGLGDPLWLTVGLYVDDAGSPVSHWRFAEPGSRAADPTVPSPVSDGTVQYTSVSVSSNAICGLDDGGRARCTLLDGGAIRGLGLHLVPTDSVFVALDAGDTFGCGLTESGAIVCWYNVGRRVDGVWRIDNAHDVPVPERFADVPESFVALSVGAGHACALNDVGNAFCWGDNSFGQLGLGEGAESSVRVPTAVVESKPDGRLLRLSDIHAGRSHTCGVAMDPRGYVYCWGDSSDGRVSIVYNGMPVPWPVQSAQNGHPDRFSGGPTFTCIAEETSLGGACWGLSWYPEKGAELWDLLPRGDIDGPSIQDVAGGAHRCARNGAWVAYCWGGNSEGQLGRGTQDSGSREVMPVQGDALFKELASSGWRTCGVTSQGEIYCWGTGKDPEGPRDVPVGE